jgi:ABC-type uncharacterized transport system fused permease/ATPase subunit
LTGDWVAKINIGPHNLVDLWFQNGLTFCADCNIYSCTKNEQFKFILQVFNISGMNMDADQRITHDVEKLTNDLAGLVTGMVKPLVDILW